MTLPSYDGVLDLLKQGATAEAQQQFNALHEKALKLRQPNHPRSDRIRASEAERGSGGQLESDGMACYLVENGRKSGPFCRRCCDTESKLVRLRALDVATYVCPNCKMESARNLCG